MADFHWNDEDCDPLADIQAAQELILSGKPMPDYSPAQAAWLEQYIADRSEKFLKLYLFWKERKEKESEKTGNE